MTKIDIITANPYQTMLIKLENGQNLDFTIWYSYNQQGWFYSFIYNQNGYAVNNRRMVTSINMLRGLRYVIPFGLACVSVDKYEPVFIEDFQSGRISLYTLNENDVILAEDTLVSLK